MGPPGFLVRMARAVEAHGDRPAIVDRGQVALTHAALWGRAHALARALRARGVGPEALVALDVARSPELVIGMIGAWLAGAAFWVLSAHDPPARRRRMLEEARPQVVLDHAELAALADAARAGGGAPSIAAPPPAPAQLAYVVYTSGSTGAPKGVAVTHAGLPALIEAQLSAFRLHPAARALWMLAPSFDASISDVTTTLAAGGALCLEDAEDTAPERLWPLCARRGITHVDLPPALLARLDRASTPPSLETLVIGGEVCPAPVVRRWAARVNLVVVYGPSEATICASLARATPAWSDDAIGEPIEGVTFRVVDDDGRDADEGELWIGGPAVARGYLGRPELTAARFVEARGLRWYRTGDRVARGAQYVFRGRADRQIKVHGQRVELEEIERVLREAPGVEHAAVAHAPPATLIAYATPRGVDLSALAAHARAHLPPYMVPTQWAALDALPATAIGKIDRAALADDAAPASALERAVAEAWQAALGGALPTRHAHFFEAGGDSISALSLVAQARARGVHLAPSAPHLHPTLAALAASALAPAPIEGRSAIELAREVTPLVVAPRPPEGPPRVVLLTGATGTLGRALLPRLLAHTEATVLALVRAPHDRAAAERLGVVHPRVRAVAGALESADLAALGADTVVHAAAAVNLGLPYAQLRAANVEGTRRVLALPAHLHYVSTLSVIVSAEPARAVAMEADALDGTTRVWGGYAESKWVAERCVRAADPSARIYRLGLVVGDPAAGHHAPRELLSAFVRGIHALGRAPRGPTSAALAMDLTPLDEAADRLARLIARAPAGTYHLANARAASLEAWLAAIEEARGAPLLRVDEGEWPTVATRTADEAAAHLALCRVSPALFAHHRALDLFQATGVTFDDRAARAVLGDAPWPAPDHARLVRTARAILAASPHSR